MKQIILKTYNGVLALATSLIKGVNKHGVTAKIKQNTEEAITADRSAAVAAADTPGNRGHTVMREFSGAGNGSLSVMGKFSAMENSYSMPRCEFSGRENGSSVIKSEFPATESCYSMLIQVTQTGVLGF